jgi:hypothetical protein
MGPTALFDKSFLQSLNLNESVLFDNFFLTNIAPLFFVETLADLEKAVREGRTPEQEVGIIASKTPEMNSSPNQFHGELCISSLMGLNTPMDGRIIRAGGRPVKDGGKTGIVFDIPPEAKAFARWQEGKFLEVEQKFAKAWRAMLRMMSFDNAINNIKIAGIQPDSCKSLEEAKQVAEEFVLGGGDKFAIMKLALTLLSIPSHIHVALFTRWKISGYKPLGEFAPYAAFVSTVNIFFYIAVASKLISADRVSNKIDLAYLFYLPFCMLFISTDKLHRRCAPLFLREDQQFIWGENLKCDLKNLDEFYDELPQAEKEKGLYSFASEPPRNESFLVTNLWDRCIPKWRDIKSSVPSLDKAVENKIADEVTQMTEARTLEPEEVDFDMTNPDSLTLQRRISKRKGKWWLLPKDLESGKKNKIGGHHT